MSFGDSVRHRPPRRGPEFVYPLNKVFRFLISAPVVNSRSIARAGRSTRRRYSAVPVELSWASS